MSVDRVQEGFNIPADHYECIPDAMAEGSVQVVREGVCTWCLVKVSTGEAHPARCEEPVTCLRCHKPGHKMRQCPEPKPTEGPGAKPAKAGGKRKPAGPQPAKGAAKPGQNDPTVACLWSMKKDKIKGPDQTINALLIHDREQDDHHKQPEQVLIDLAVNANNAMEGDNQQTGIEHFSTGNGGGLVLGWTPSPVSWIQGLA